MVNFAERNRWKNASIERTGRCGNGCVNGFSWFCIYLIELLNFWLSSKMIILNCRFSNLQLIYIIMVEEFCLFCFLNFIKSYINENLFRSQTLLKSYSLNHHRTLKSKTSEKVYNIIESVIKVTKFRKQQNQENFWFDFSEQKLIFLLIFLLT